MSNNPNSISENSVNVDLEQVWQEYRLSLKRFLLKNLNNPSEVDDLLQDIMLKTYQKLPTLRDSGKLKSWLFQIASNTLHDYYRRSSVPLESAEDAHWQAIESDHDSDTLAQLSDCLKPFIEQLPAKQAAPLIAIDLEGQSQKSYAEENNLNYSTLKSQIQKSRQQVLKVFQNCCEFQMDTQGNVMDYQQRSSKCGRC